MIVYSCNDLLMHVTFPSSLKGMVSDWFCYLPPHSLYNFEEMSEEYASRQEAKKNNHHLLTVKMRQSDSLKSYIGYFQSQLVKIPNCR